MIMTITSTEIMKIRAYKVLTMPSMYNSFLGKLPADIQWTMLLHGIAGSGKSTYSLILAREFAKYGDVLYGNFEEQIGPTLQEKIKVAKANSTKIHFLRSNNKDEFWRQIGTGKYKFCIIDSLSMIANTKNNIIEFFEKIRQHQGIIFIIISHARRAKDGKRESDYKGISEIEHLVDIKQRVIDGVVWNDKNRFLGKDCLKADGYNLFRNMLVRYRNRNVK